MKRKAIFIPNNKIIDSLDIEQTEQVLIDSGIDPDNATTVLQTIGYSLLDIELYPKESEV